MADQLAPIIPIIIIVVAILLVTYRAKTSHFECPACGCLFKVPVSVFLTSFHMLGKRNVTCPHCGYRGMLPPIKDDKE